jgi:hypothetical protein
VIVRRLCGRESIAIRKRGVELRSPKTLLLQAHQSMRQTDARHGLTHRGISEYGTCR